MEAVCRSARLLRCRKLPPPPQGEYGFHRSIFRYIRGMNDWRSRSDLNSRDLLKVAAAILGLLFGCVFLIWLVAKLVR